MTDFRSFRRLSSFSGIRLAHPSVQGQIRLIHKSLGFPSARAFDVFFETLNNHLRPEWPEYEDSRRLTLFERALNGEKIRRSEIVGPHQELDEKLPKTLYE